MSIPVTKLRSAPLFQGPAEDARTEKILVRMLILLPVLLVCLTLAGHLFGQNRPEQFSVRYMLIVVTLTALAVQRRSGTACALRLILRGFLLVILAHAVFLGGVRGPAMVGVPTLLLMSAWSLRRAEALLLAIASALAIALAAALEISGILIPSPRHTIDYLFALGVAIPVATVMGTYLLSRLQSQIELANEGSRRLERELATRAAVEQDLHERNDDLRLIHQLSARVHRLRDVDSIMREAIGAIVDVTGSRQVTTYLLEPDGQHMRLVASHGFDEAFERAAARYPLEGSWSVRAFDEDRPLVTTDIGAEPRYTPEIRDALIAHSPTRAHRSVARPSSFRRAWSTASRPHRWRASRRLRAPWPWRWPTFVTSSICSTRRGAMR
jgi:hypothetical protein